MPGLNAISALISAVKSVERGLLDGSYAREAVQKNSDRIIEMNVEQLYEHGVNSLGVSISTYAPYTPYTLRVKKEKGQPVDRVTLRDTGAFHEGFRLVVDPVGFGVTSTDDKTEGLVEKYRESIFGLTEANMTRVTWDYFYPVIVAGIRKTLFK